MGLGSYRLAEENLEELCQIHLSYKTIADIAVATGGELAAKTEKDTGYRRVLLEAFQSAVGETEFQCDGTSVNTRNADGKKEWREMKLYAFLKRLCGASASVFEWESRILPEASIMYAFAAIEEKSLFQVRCDAARRELGIGGISSALGDGAKWIWNLVYDVFGKTDECLDFYHAAEKLSDCGKTLFGEGESFKAWFERMRIVLLSEGLGGIESELQSLEGGLKKGQRLAVNSLLVYLRGNAGRVNYSERLAKGRSIGSGLIEGACKNLVGKRLKQTGACWRVQRVNRIAVLSSLLYSNHWKLAWKKST